MRQCTSHDRRCGGQGRQFPVEMLYVPDPVESYLDAALRCVLQIHADEPPGDVLAFLTGQDENRGPAAPHPRAVGVLCALPAKGGCRVSKDAHVHAFCSWCIYWNVAAAAACSWVSAFSMHEWRDIEKSLAGACQLTSVSTAAQVRAAAGGG